ncbi:MAG: hydrogenase maturation nickel metallochaperone HypA [Thermoleophilaceae bacterium]
MHELSLSSAVLDTALRHAGGQSVKTVELTIGALRQVVSSSLEFYWEIVSRETPCEGARLELNMVEARVRCKACETEWTLDDPIFRCPSCEDSDVEVLTGTEFFVESIDVEEEACTVRE